jgi:hypothetical protein
MQRVALILMLFVLLMNGRHGGNTPPATFDSLSVQARALDIADSARSKDYGPLRLTAAWQLSGSHTAFGGFSSLFVKEDGALVALNDTGELFGFRVKGPQGGGFVEPLPRIGIEQSWPSWEWDSESMQRDPATGRIWVGFELLQRICRYAPDFKALEGCVTPRAMLRWPVTGSIESLVRFADGRFLAISEMGTNAAGAHDVLLWQGDPVDPATPPPVHLGYRPPTGYRPTDALWLGGDRLLVLNRRLTLADGFTTRLTVVTLPRLEEGAVLTGRVIATFAPPGLADNFEAMALSRDKGRPVLWVASDDNHLFLQRSLLLRFDLPADWVSDRPAP